MNLDDTLVDKLVRNEQDEHRDQTGQEAGEVPTYSPVAFTSRGRVD
ncbi:hypothetical protein FHT44_005064 [Mycolicibacterium sp. BK634]|nr:hypothetical protein [Mycolicibacterium sp. BK634]MBB3752552.1 hypothetical protein [Mycolicibacterium sp. BK634]